MKKLLIASLLLTLPGQLLASTCDNDPFASGCLKEKAVSQASSILCNDGSVIQSDGTMSDSSGNSLTNIEGGVSSASNTQSACDSHGGINAFVTSTGSLTILPNAGNAAAAASAGAGAATSAATASASGIGTDLGLGGGIDLTVLPDYDQSPGDLFFPLDDTDGSATDSTGTTSSGLTSSG
jgi:hypothetical protein